MFHGLHGIKGLDDAYLPTLSPSEVAPPEAVSSVVCPPEVEPPLAAASEMPNSRAVMPLSNWLT